MKAVLHIYWEKKDHARLDASLIWTDGCVEITEVADDLRATIQGFIDNGLGEWVGHPSLDFYRVTRAHEVAFLPRVGFFMMRQGGFSFDFINDRGESIPLNLIGLDEHGNSDPYIR